MKMAERAKKKELTKRKGERKKKRKEDIKDSY